MVRSHTRTPVHGYLFKSFSVHKSMFMKSCLSPLFRAFGPEEARRLDRLSFHRQQYVDECCVRVGCACAC
jgi:hypothetical protein